MNKIYKHFKLKNQNLEYPKLRVYVCIYNRYVHISIIFIFIKKFTSVCIQNTESVVTPSQRVTTPSNQIHVRSYKHQVKKKLKQRLITRSETIVL